MNKLHFLFITLLLGFSLPALAQTLYVDAVNGKDVAKGTVSDPLRNLEKTIRLANSFNGNQNIDIKLAPGLYVLSRESVIKTGNAGDNLKLTIEALVMPDDAGWRAEKMPVIQSVSPDN